MDKWFKHPASAIPSYSGTNTNLTKPTYKLTHQQYPLLYHK